MADIKNLVVSNVIPLASKITEHKLNGSNYYDWRRTILFYLRSTDMDDHMTEDPPKDAKQKKDWLRDDARLYLQIKNSIESEIIELVDHCESVKELLEFLDFLYSGKEQVHRMFEVCMQFFRAEQKAESVTSYFMRLKKIIAELGLLLPFSPDVKVQQVQREKMAVMIFLNGLLPEFGMAKTQILSDSKIPSLDDAFTRVLRIESSPTSVSIPQPSSALFSKNNNPRAPQRNSTDHRKPESVEIVCNYCRKPGHMKRDCRKLLYKNSQRSQHAQIASTCDIPEASVTISADEFAKFQNYQESLQASSSSTPIASTVAPGNIKCLLTSSTKWVIDSGATAHMTEWELDSTSGYYYNESNGFYYDSNSGFYYSDAIGKWVTQEEAHSSPQFFLDSKHKKPILAKPSSASASTAIKDKNVDKGEGGPPPGLVVSASLNPKRSIKGAPSSIAVGKRKRPDEKQKAISEEEKAALKAREAAKKRVEKREKPLLGLYRLP